MQYWYPVPQVLQAAAEAWHAELSEPKVAHSLHATPGGHKQQRLAGGGAGGRKTANSGGRLALRRSTILLRCSVPAGRCRAECLE